MVHIVFHTEGDLVLIGMQYSLIGKGYAMGVSSKVGDDVAGIFKRLFATVNMTWK